ncbi:MAG TPA: type II secretion system F family protein [Chthonomonadaceae bacterium]|nr:type II secretion system F family protein [Chthonomonadaceae bacterium]
MPQFAYHAMDDRGNAVAGNIDAPDMVQATEQVRQMGYTPTRVEIASEAAAPPAAPVAAKVVTASRPAAPAMDLTQPVIEMPAEANALLVPIEEGGREMQHLEPWQRGGPVPQPAPPPAMTTVAPVQAAPPAPVEASVPATAEAVLPAGRPGVERPPFGPGTRPEVSLGERIKETFLYPIYSGVVLKDMAPYFRQFATLIGAGLPLYQSLVALEGNTSNPRLKEVTRTAQKQVQAGGRFSDVMAAYPHIFSAMQIEMIRAAELGGMLEQTLRHIANYVDHEMEIRRLIRYETLYPKIVIFFALMILGRPGFAMGPPAISSLILSAMGKGEYSFAQYLMDTVGFGLAIALPILAAVVVFRLFLFNSKSVRESYDAVKLGIPVLGNVIKMFIIARFVRTFAALYRGGFSIPTSLQIASDSSANWVLKHSVQRAFRATQEGGLVSQALHASGFFPAMTVDMFRTGEMTGNLDDMLDKVADHYEAEAKTKSHQIAVIFSVVVFLIVASLVAVAILGQWGKYASGATNPNAGD